MRIGRPGEVKDLFHDFVQVVHFVGDDSGVFGAWVIRSELQVQRVVEQFHHRERIADFVGDLGRQ